MPVIGVESCAPRERSRRSLSGRLLTACQQDKIAPSPTHGSQSCQSHHEGTTGEKFSVHCFSFCQFLHREDTYTAHAQHEQLTTQPEWSVGKAFGPHTPGTVSYLYAINEQTSFITLDFNAIDMPS